VNPQLFLHTAQSSLLGQSTPINRTLYIRTDVVPESLSVVMESEIRSIDGNVAISNITTMDEQIRRSPTGFGIARSAVLFSAFLGGLGLLLALVGTYGALAFMVGQRAQEIGVRIALGAGPSRVLRIVVWHGLALAAVGGVAGVALGAAA